MSEYLTGGASITAPGTPPLQQPAPEVEPSKWHRTFLQITQGNAIISVLAVLLAVTLNVLFVPSLLALTLALKY